MSQCENQEILKALDEDLNALAKETDIELPANLSPQERAKRVSLIFERKTRRPASFREAIELLFNEPCFRDAIRGRLKELEIFDTVKRRGLLADVEADVLAMLAFVLIRNAGKYYAKMVRAEAILEEYRDLFQRVVADLRHASGFDQVSSQTEINALPAKVAALLKQPTACPASWSEVKSLVAAQGPLCELAELLGWKADDLNALIVQIYVRALTDKKLSWNGWLSIHIRSLTKRIAEDHLAQSAIQLGPPPGKGDEHYGHDAGGGFELSRENAPDQGLLLTDEHPKIGRENYEQSQADVHFSAEVRESLLLVSILAEAAPYGVVRVTAIAHPPRGTPKVLGAALLALSLDSSDGSARRGSIEVEKLHGPKPANSRVSYSIEPAGASLGKRGRGGARDGFTADEIRRLSESAEVNGNAALKADICRLIQLLA
jgi:hypothetical protein